MFTRGHNQPYPSRRQRHVQRVHDTKHGAARTITNKPDRANRRDTSLDLNDRGEQRSANYLGDIHVGP